MNLQPSWRAPTVLAFGLCLAACVGGITRHDESAAWRYRGEKFRAVSVSLTNEARAQLNDNAEFDPDHFEQTLRSTLDARGLIDTRGAHSVQVELTDLRVRSTFWAFMLNVIYGRDRVAGTVVVLASSGAELHRFSVRASNLLAGVATAPSGMRTRWLYQEFARLTVEEIERVEQSQLVAVW